MLQIRLVRHARYITVALPKCFTTSMAEYALCSPFPQAIRRHSVSVRSFCTAGSSGLAAAQEHQLHPSLSLFVLPQVLLGRTHTIFYWNISQYNVYPQQIDQSSGRISFRTTIYTNVTP